MRPVLAQSRADLYDAEGFLMTGDVMEQTAPDTFVWIDRVKNIIKLSQVID
jgi:fatty acid CoA ligase FadD9